MKYTETHIYICLYAMLKLRLNMGAKDVVRYCLCYWHSAWDLGAGKVSSFLSTVITLGSMAIGIIWSSLRSTWPFVFYLLGPVWAMLRNVGLSICKKHPWLKRITVQNHGVWLCTLQRLRDLSKNNGNLQLDGVFQLKSKHVQVYDVIHVTGC